MSYKERQLQKKNTFDDTSPFILSLKFINYIHAC